MIRILFILACLVLPGLALPARAELKIQQVTSPGGITAWLVEDHNIPFTALEIQFRGGTSLDAPGKRGAVNLMAALIEEGAGDMDSVAFAEARDALAAEFHFNAHGDGLGISARFLTENRDAAVDLLQQALVRPRFDQDAVDRVRGQVLSILRSNEKDPNALASEAFAALAYGDHPYGSVGDGTVESVTALTRDDILAAHAAVLARDRIFVAASGDVTAEELAVLLDRLFGALPASGAAQHGDAELRFAGGTTVIDFPSPQSTVLFGQPGIARDDPDFFAAFILNEALGGGRFTARLMSEIREKRGLTYGIGTYLLNMDHADMLMGQFSASNDKVAEAIAVLKAEWQKTATEGISEAELEATKTYLVGSYPLRFNGNGAIAGILVGMQMDGLPIDYAVTRNAKIEAVTMDDIRRVAARLIDPNGVHFVVVGQPEGL